MGEEGRLGDLQADLEVQGIERKGSNLKQAGKHILLGCL